MNPETIQPDLRKVLRRLKLSRILDTLPAIGLPYMASAFGIFLLRQTFKTIPKELGEAAMVDGANTSEPIVGGVGGDIAKGFLAVTVVRFIMPDLIWAHVMAGIFSVLGHNWSLWLYLLTGKLFGYFR